MVLIFYIIDEVWFGLFFAQSMRKNISSYFGAPKLLNFFRSSLVDPKRVTFCVFLVLFIFAFIVERDVKAICYGFASSSGDSKIPYGHVFLSFFLGERTLTNETDKKSCCKSNGHHRSATKAEHLLLFQRQHDPAADVRTCQFF